uniref:Uncharacterized protein n=1 Tax=Octopus bimaculoides TaxID=37653 RepID=A0A0L8G421_OCTBM
MSEKARTGLINLAIAHLKLVVHFVDQSHYEHCCERGSLIISDSCFFMKQ